MAALRGDADTAGAYGELPTMRATEDSQDQATVRLCDAFIAAARDDPDQALRHARATFDYLGGLGVAHIIIQWAWPLAARSAHQLGDRQAVNELIGLLDGYPVGHLPPLLRAERAQAHARMADDSEAGAVALANSVAALRQVANPYHLAHGLLDYAQHLGAGDDPSRVRALVAEAIAIADSLGASPLWIGREKVLEVSGAESVSVQVEVD